jgi:ABC-type transport system substrate-binding protein
MKRILYVTLTLIMLGVFALPGNAQEENVVRIVMDIGGMTSMDNQYWTHQTRINEGTTLEGLFGYDKDGLTLIPKIAESWELSDDQLEWTIKLRKDKRWSNGEAVTAHDFYESWRDFVLDNQAVMWASFMTYTNGYTARGAGNADLLTIEAVDDYTLKIVTDRPKPALYAWLAMTQAYPNYPPAFEEHPNDWWAVENWVGNGPYIPVEFRPGEFLAVERNPEYVGEAGVDYGNVDRIEFMHGISQMLPTFEAGEADVIGLIGIADITYAQQNEELAPLIHVFDSFDWGGYQTNKTHESNLDNQNLRQALYMAIDREYICKELQQGLCEPAHSYGWTQDPRIADEVEGLPYNPDMAREKLDLALEELGYASVEDLPQFVFYTPPANSAGMPVYETYLDMWKEELGVDAIIQPDDYGINVTYTWNVTNPNLEEGFTPVGGGMLLFDPAYLTNQALQTVWTLGFNGDIRAMVTENQEMLNEINLIDTLPDEETIEAEWALAEEMVSTDYVQLFEEAGYPYTARAIAIAGVESEQLAAIREQWEAAESDEEKLGVWKNLRRFVEGRKPSHTKWDWLLTEDGADHARLQEIYMQLDMSDYGDEAFALAAEAHQLAIEMAYLVPVSIPQIYYLVREGVENVTPRYVSMGSLSHFQYLEMTK